MEKGKKKSPVEFTRPRLKGLSLQKACGQTAGVDTEGGDTGIFPPENSKIKKKNESPRMRP